jgi:transcriptional regulator GlxA family with amidase domain
MAARLVSAAAGVFSKSAQSTEEGKLPGTARYDLNRLLLRARDTMDRDYAGELDVAALAASAFLSRAHFIRSFRVAFGETPHRYLQRRRLERAMALLRDTDKPVTEICFDVGFASLGSFSRTFSEVIGSSPRAYRKSSRVEARVPGCMVRLWNRPSEHFQRSAVDDSEVA